MKAPRWAPEAARITFRAQLLIAMMLLVSSIIIIGLYVAERSVLADAERGMQSDFQNQIATLHRAESNRQAALTETCRTLIAKPRLHAALEDNALDLLYPTAKDELRDFLHEETGAAAAETARGSHAHFYRFLDRTGAIISPPDRDEAGRLSPGEESDLALRALPDNEQLGFMHRAAISQDSVDEIYTIPIASTETGEIIAALVAGFRSITLSGAGAGAGLRAGVWLRDELYLTGMGTEARKDLAGELRRRIGAAPSRGSFRSVAGGAAYEIFYEVRNPQSAYPAAYEVCVYPLAAHIARQHRWRWGIGGVGSMLLAGGLLASQFASARLSKPMEELAARSESNRADRERAEATLATTNAELQRSARFSADASHQLKTPVTVLRAGLEALLARENFAPEIYDELSALLHQTYRITGVVDDLLLLSRMDAGRLQIQFTAVNLSLLLEEWIDDVSALPDPVTVEIETNFPAGLYVSGEKRFIAIIVQNLLENARKYNREGGKICVAAEVRGDDAVLTVENTGPPIAAASREHIFERFHRGAVGENVPGHGLGLNLARELARLHGGELRLVRSDDEWTEFEVRFRMAEGPAATTSPA